jgi:hypothetical protein
MPNGETRRCGGPRTVSMSVRPFSSSVEAGTARPGGVSCSRRRYGSARMLHCFQLVLVGHPRSYARLRGDDKSRTTASDYIWVTASSSRVWRRPDRRISYLSPPLPRLAGAHQQGKWSPTEAPLSGDSAEAAQPGELRGSGCVCHRNGRASVGQARPSNASRCRCSADWNGGPTLTTCALGVP